MSFYLGFIWDLFVNCLILLSITKRFLIFLRSFFGFNVCLSLWRYSNVKLDSINKLVKKEEKHSKKLWIQLIMPLMSHSHRHSHCPVSLVKQKLFLEGKNNLIKLFFYLTKSFVHPITATTTKKLVFTLFSQQVGKLHTQKKN